MNDAGMNSMNIVNSVSIFDDIAIMNSIFSENYRIKRVFHVNSTGSITLS
jgi:hypothetical protein